MTEHVTANTPLICSDERHAAKVADLEQRIQQAEELLRIAHETSNRSEAERARAVRRAEQLAAAVLRIHTLADEHPVAIPTHLVDEALDQPAAGTAATEATDAGQ